MCPLILSMLLSLFAAAPAGRDTPPPNRLTPQEIADGWVLLFDGETTFGWRVDGQADVKNGVIVVGGVKESKTSLGFGLFELRWDCSWLGAEPPRFQFASKRGGGFGGPFPTFAKTNVNDTSWRTQLFRIEAAMEGETSVKAEAVKGPKSLPIAMHTIKFPPKDLDAEVEITVPAGTTLFLRNLKLKPMGTKSLFNGKDLTGWKVFDDGKRNKSKFAVVDGAINVKDGPGDLQTEGKFGDFVLQVDCISHGKHLNSGIFFRCREGEYQNGYEMQVRNQFTAEPTQEYVVEKYDPETHKLVGKDKVKSPAVDFGTGAIYRRVPARKEASKDGEWVTLTLVARGNRFATWVNGIQQVDWTDHRPPSDNARTGYRREAGHISIQGHDPTTNLSFKNWRIAELPAK